MTSLFLFTPGGGKFFFFVLVELHVSASPANSHTPPIDQPRAKARGVLGAFVTDGGILWASSLDFFACRAVNLLFFFFYYCYYCYYYDYYYYFYPQLNLETFKKIK